MTILRNAIKNQRRGFASITTTPTQRPALFEELANGPDRLKQLNQFTISKERGFLPIQDPLVKLPKVFDPLDSVLKRMTMVQPDGSQGLLLKGQFGDAVDAELKNAGLEKQVKDVIASGDQHLMSALFRDYSFATSAFLFEPVDQHFRATGSYGTGREVLPASLAVPMNDLANALGQFPFMEYSTSYALQNYERLQNTSSAPHKLGRVEEYEPDNLRLIRAFQDASGSEGGFVIVHIVMVAYSGNVVRYTEDVLEAARAGDVAGFNQAMRGLLKTYENIQVAMELMWQWSRPSDYIKFRSFIFGTGPEKANAMFPDGVVYEGVSDKPQVFRGESGANDSLVPVLDNLLEVTARLPKNELTEMLRDFRTYRPSTQRVYLETLEKRATEASIAKFARGNTESLALYLLMVDQIREFRDRHWRFVKSYIIARTDYPIATGGSPILKYLPNNLRTVLTVLGDTFDLLPTSQGVPEDLVERVDAARKRADIQIKALDREVVSFASQVTGAHDKKGTIRGSVGCDGVG